MATAKKRTSEKAKSKVHPPLPPHEVDGGKKIASRGELEQGFGKLVEAKHAVNEAEVFRDQLKAKADQQFDEKAAGPKQVLQELEPPCEQFCRDHRAELCGPDKKSAIVGPVTIEFRMNPPGLLTKSGEKLDAEKVIAKIETLAEKLDKNDKRELLGCLKVTTSLDQAALKKLAVPTLSRLGIRIHQEERFTWKPNAER
ncbi:MAG: host-nuclease inhibitor Gam family protein [bacterium]|nr:host-nuclease inhibitor Gam family protein [bacterium]